MARFSKFDWLDLGLETLVRDGSSAIRIDTLCAHAGRTKGSFYHHFKDRDAFVADLMIHWEEGLTARVIAAANKADSALGRLESLNHLAGDIDAGLERALRRWAGSDPMVQAAVARVDKRRVDYLASLWLQAKDISSQQAIDLAVMNYVSMVGFQQIYTPVSQDRRRRIDQLFAQLTAGFPDRD